MRFAKNRGSPHGGKHTSLARVARLATTCMRRPPGDRPRPVRVPCAQSPSFSPSVSTLQYTRGLPRRRRGERRRQRADGRTDGRGRWSPFYLDSYVSTAVPCSVLLAPSLPPWFVRRTSLDRPSVCAAAAHEFSPARGGNEGAAPHRGQLRSALWIVI